MPEGKLEVMPGADTATLPVRGPAEVATLRERIGQPVHHPWARQYRSARRSARRAPVPPTQGPAGSWTTTAFAWAAGPKRDAVGG